jgi:hypothetical protein
MTEFVLNPLEFLQAEVVVPRTLRLVREGEFGYTGGIDKTSRGQGARG